MGEEDVLRVKGTPAALLITPSLPCPNGSGLQQRAYQWTIRLADQYALTVLVIDDPLPDGQRLPQSLVSLVQEVRFANAKTPPQFEQSFQHYVVFRLRMHRVARTIRCLSRSQTATLDVDDLESATLASIALFAFRRGRLRLAVRSVFEALRSFIQEQWLPRFYQRVCVAAPDDLHSLPNSSIRFCMPNRTAAVAARLASPNNETPTLLFVGTLSYFPNEDAVLWLAEDIVPRIRCLYPDRFRLIVIGRFASERLRKRMATIPEIEFHGQAQHVEPFYREAHLALVPLRCGGGTKLKALEAIAFGRPLVSTHHGARGLGLRPGLDYLAASNATEFAMACAALMIDPTRAESVADAAASRMSARPFEDCT